MAILDIPAKIIEKVESLVETKMATTTELMKFIYSQEDPDKKPVTEAEVFKTFKSLYGRIDNLLTQNALEAFKSTSKNTVPWKRYAVYAGGILILLMAGCLYGYFYFIKKITI